MATADGAIVSLRGLTVIRRRRRILEVEKLDILQGTTRVRGPNGAGKSTLLKVAAGLWRPRAGTVKVLGMDLPREARRIHGRMGYLSQETVLPTSFTASEVVAYSGWLKGMSSGDSARAAGPALERLGLSGAEQRPVGALSGGMQRRVLFAAETFHRPDLLLLDEPFSGVDQESRVTLASEVATLRTRGTVVVVVTHDESDATLLVPDRVVELDRGDLSSVAAR